jgi:hypothetical protein
MFQSAFGMNFSSGRDLTWQEDKSNMGTHEFVPPSWLTRQIGFQLAHEQFNVAEQVELGTTADEAAFDLLAVSDDFQPWQAKKGIPAQAWITMSAIGQRTQRIRMGTTVICPTFRYYPGSCRRGLRLAESSLSGAYFSWHRFGQHDQKRVIDFSGKEVLPRLRKAVEKAE